MQQKIKSNFPNCSESKLVYSSPDLKMGIILETLICCGIKPVCKERFIR